MMTSYRFSISNKIRFIVVTLVLFMSILTALISYTNAKIQDKNISMLLSSIISETNEIEFAAQSDNLDLIKQSINDLRKHPNVQTVEIYAYREGQFFTTKSGIFNESMNPSHLIGLAILNNAHIRLDSTKQIFFPGVDLTLFDPIVKNKQVIGGTFVRASLNQHAEIVSTLHIIILIALVAIFLGYRAGEWLVSPLLYLSHVMTKLQIENNYALRAKNKSHDEIGQVTNTFNALLDKIQSNDELQRLSQEQIKKLAYFSTLTGLPNRDFFKELFKQALSEARQKNQLLAVLYLDLDNFKRVNDTFGHDVGDEVLQQTAKKIKRYLYSLENSSFPEDENADFPLHNAIMAHLSGDEFIVILKNVESIDEVKNVADHIIKVSYQPYVSNRKEIIIAASVGIALYPAHGDTMETLIRNADTAMYASKKTGKGAYTVFNSKMASLLIDKVEIERDLSEALFRKELVLYYQPKFDLNNNSIAGFEALLRWQHPTRGFLSPDEFIPIAENSGLIIPIGEWVIQEAAKQCQTWRALGYPISMSVNISPRQFTDPLLIKTIESALHAAQLNSEYFELELTEGMLLVNDQKTMDILFNFKKLGVKISIDDFGTGYSSLRYLVNYPLDVLKIDKSFMAYLNESKRNSSVTKAIIDLSHDLGLTVVAEGVETIDQLKFLRAHRCDLIQGYIISQPVAGKEVPTLLTKYKDYNV